MTILKGGNIATSRGDVISALQLEFVWRTRKKARGVRSTSIEQAEKGLASCQWNLD